MVSELPKCVASSSPSGAFCAVAVVHQESADLDGQSLLEPSPVCLATAALRVAGHFCGKVPSYFIEGFSLGLRHALTARSPSNSTPTCPRARAGIRRMY